MTKLLTIFFVWCVVYAIVTSTLFGFRWTEITLPLPLQTLILTAFLVPMISLVFAPNAEKLAEFLLNKGAGSDHPTAD
ncbi:hypothetical protein O4H61_12105 [Roseovarius aestuarii]|nr:hypothetical protein [Roseovarius aestuarii]